MSKTKDGGPARDTYDDVEIDGAEGDEWEWALGECARTSDGACGHAGSEYCEFECPFRGKL